MSARLSAHIVCGPGCGFSCMAFGGIAGGGLFPWRVPAIVWQHYDIGLWRIARLVILVDVANALDIATLSALGLEVEENAGLFAVTDVFEQLAFGEVEVELDRLSDSGGQCRMALDVIAHRRRGAAAVTRLEDLGSRRDQAEG